MGLDPTAAASADAGGELALRDQPVRDDQPVEPDGLPEETDHLASLRFSGTGIHLNSCLIVYSEYGFPGTLLVMI